MIATHIVVYHDGAHPREWFETHFAALGYKTWGYSGLNGAYFTEWRGGCDIPDVEALNAAFGTKWEATVKPFTNAAAMNAMNDVKPLSTSGEMIL